MYSPNAKPEDIALLEAHKKKIVDMKAAKASKEELGPAIEELKRLKDLCGEVAPAKKK